MTSHDRRDNPAGRLLILFERVRKHSKDTKCRDAWRQAVTGENEDEISEAEFLRRMSTVYKLPGLVRDVVPHVPALSAAENLVSGTLSKIEQVLGTFQGGTIDSMNKQLGDSMTSLQFMSASLSTSEFAEPILDDEFLEKVRTEATSLFSEIDKADLPRAEKVHLLNLIDLIQNAIVEVDAAGAASLHASASEVLGILVTEHPVTGASHFRQRIGDFAWGVASSVVAQGLVTTAPALQDGFEAIVKGLPS